MISLVGLPGSGKSTIARKVAKRLGWQYADTDAEIEREAGCSIAALFARFGEERFRDLEEQALDRLTRASTAVIATGGGSVLRLSNRAVLRSRTTVVHLDVPRDELIRRLRGGSRRPLFRDLAPDVKLEELAIVRDPLYLEVAHASVSTEGLSLDQVVARITALVGADASELRGDTSSSR